MPSVSAGRPSRQWRAAAGGAHASRTPLPDEGERGHKWRRSGPPGAGQRTGRHPARLITLGHGATEKAGPRFLNVAAASAGTGIAGYSY